MKYGEIEKLRSLLLALFMFLEENDERSWSKSIQSMIQKIDTSLLAQVSSKEIIDYVRCNYKSINSGNGSFSDFYIWRDNFEDRKNENSKLEKIKNDLWKFLF